MKKRRTCRICRCFRFGMAKALRVGFRCGDERRNRESHRPCAVVDFGPFSGAESHAISRAVTCSLALYASQKSSHFRCRCHVADASHRLGCQRSCVAAYARRRVAARHRSSKEYVGASHCPGVTGDLRGVRTSRHDALAFAARARHRCMYLWVGACAAVDARVMCGISLASAGRLVDALRCAALLAASNALSVATLCDDGVECGVVRRGGAGVRDVAVVVVRPAARVRRRRTSGVGAGRRRLSGSTHRATVSARSAAVHPSMRLVREARGFGPANNVAC